MAKEDFDLFWNTHLHTGDSTNQSVDSIVLFCHSVKEDTVNYPWARRESTIRQHPLAAVARDIMTQVRVATRKTALEVTILQNVSPCADCAAELIKAISLSREKKVKLEITIAFVALHKIRLQSCSHRGYQCAADVFLNESTDNALALRTLSEEGVKVRTFNPALWQFLHTFVGMGIPSPYPNSFLSGKYNGATCQHRTAEDSSMASELRTILTGLQITSGSLSPDQDGYTAEWKAPKVPAKKVGEYRITYKKISLRNKDSEEKYWKIHQTLSSSPIKVSSPGELTSWRLTGLERDSFYELTVEAILGSTVVASSKRIFKTEDKVSIPSLASPKKPLLRRNSSLSSASLSRFPNGHSK
ncbi:uncharacterized protein [Littorina saxatilis]|uniref:Activation-induced cytidine deaminase AID domain-containing protein n=1 Tax=Littorina saxatilis TaxID=31220 RepID=A0AAN9GGQ4_9CAEN